LERHITCAGGPPHCAQNTGGDTRQHWYDLTNIPVRVLVRTVRSVPYVLHVDMRANSHADILS